MPCRVEEMFHFTSWRASARQFVHRCMGWTCRACLLCAIFRTPAVSVPGLPIGAPEAQEVSWAELKKAVLEPRQGGRWCEIGADGSECNWGRVLVWDPPVRLILAWQINADWQYDPNLVTEVEVNSVEQGLNLTRFTLEHRDMEKFGVKAQEMWKAFDSDGGWTGILNALAKFAES